MTMLTTNPTALTLGKTGTLAGQTWRVVGRVVVGMEEAGEFYSWQEFNLSSLDDRESATLVYETTEDGEAAWKLFVYFTPDKPLSAAEAKRYRVGQNYLVEGHSAQVTLVDESRVYHIEGTAPEGVQVGDIAHYFNAETTDAMIVVSWTGDEVEYFHGTELDAETVERAFQLSTEASHFHRRPHLGKARDEPGVTQVGKVIVIGVVLIVGCVVAAQFLTEHPSRTTRVSSYVVPPAPKPPTLAIGASGLLDQRQYLIAGQTACEFASTRGKRLRYDYHLVGSDGTSARLVCTLDPARRQWQLLKETKLPVALTPQQAASYQVGATLAAFPYSPRVENLYRLTALTNEGTVPGGYTLNQSTYHLSAESVTQSLHLAWDAAQVQAFEITELSEQAVAVAFTVIE